MPCTPSSESAWRTSSSFWGLMMAVMNFTVVILRLAGRRAGMARPTPGNHTNAKGLNQNESGAPVCGNITNALIWCDYFWCVICRAQCLMRRAPDYFDSYCRGGGVCRACRAVLSLPGPPGVFPRTCVGRDTGAGGSGVRVCPIYVRGRGRAKRLVYPGAQGPGHAAFLPWQRRQYLAPPGVHPSISPSRTQRFYFRLPRLRRKRGRAYGGGYVPRRRGGVAPSGGGTGLGAGTDYLFRPLPRP